MRLSAARSVGLATLLGLTAAMITAGGGAPAGAGDIGPAISVLGEEDLESFGATTLEELRNATPIPALDPLGFTDVETQLIDVLLRPTIEENYAFGDDRSVPPVIDIPAARPARMGNLQVELDSSQLPQFGMDTANYFHGQGDLNGPFTLVVVENEGPFDGTNGLAINEGGVFQLPSMIPWNSTFDGDTWEGGNIMPTATYGPNPFQFDVFRFEPPQSFPTDPGVAGFVFRNEEYLVVGVSTPALTATDPLSDIMARVHIHHSSGARSPGTVHRGEFMPVLDNDPIAPGTFLTIIDPVPEPAPEPEPSPDPDAEVSDTPVTPEITETPELIDPQPGFVDPVETPDGTTSGTRTWVAVALITLGGVTIALGYWVYTRTRVRGGANTPETPTPPVSSVPRTKDPDSACDWELEILELSGWKKLKQADPGHHPCCVYRVEIVTTIAAHDQVASFRQDVSPERQYIPDYNFAWSALNLDANASTRSGPAGRQDWQHGLGDPIDQTGDAPDEGYRQGHQGEERPEVAAHLHRDETTLVKVTLESGCAGSRHEYSARGESTIRMLATQECTNDDPADACPVELNAFGMQETLVSGDLSISTMHAIGTDIDELEGRSEVALWDSHDHDSRARLTHEHSDFAYDKGDKESFEWSAAFRSMTTLDAGQIVPQHVWPTTERVTTHIEQSMRHELELSGVMHKDDCETDGCCGNSNHACKCAPEFEMTLDGGSSTITVDGKVTVLGRGWPADRKQPHLAGDTDTWEADPVTP